MKELKGAIIGKDIDYSKSPALYNTYFNDIGILGFYEILNFDTQSDLEKFILSGEVRKYDFVNITQPYKSVFLKHLTNNDIVVKETMSVNLVIIKDDELVGYNTDAEGFYNYYFDDLVGCSISDILLVGTGAMARTAKIYIQQAISANLSVMSPRNNSIPEFFDDLQVFHPYEVDGPALCYKFDLMIFAASHKAEKILVDMPLNVEKIINVNYQSKELEDFAKLNHIKYTDGRFMLLEQFKENLRMLNIYDKNYNFDSLMKKIF